MIKLPLEIASPFKAEQFEQRPAEESATHKSAQNFVTCIHRAKLAGLFRNITVTWSKSLIGHSLYIVVDSHSEENHSCCKIDLKTWQFWGKKGLKSFRVEEKRVDVFWDLRAAKFSSSPEPTSDYYVAMVSEEEVVLLLGDQKKEAYKRTKSRPSLLDAALVHKKENVFAKKFFCTRTILGQGQKEHDIIIESALSGPNDPEMWITVDGTISVRIINLHWRFRGNETILVDDIPVLIFWDVHDWLYNSNSSGVVGTFIFMQGALEGESAGSDDGGKNSRTDDTGDISCELLELTSTVEFCHCLYAWKTE